MLHVGVTLLTALAIVAPSVRPTLEFAAIAALAWAVPLALAGALLLALRTGPGGWVAISIMVASGAAVWLAGVVVGVPAAFVASGIGGITLLVAGALLHECVRELRVRMSLAVLATMLIGGACAGMQLEGIMVAVDQAPHVALIAALVLVAIGLGSPPPEGGTSRRRQGGQLRAM